MTRARWHSMAFVLLCAIQLGVPAWTIARHEATLHRGEIYRFRCRPVDPVDLFRGRYVALAFEQELPGLSSQVKPGQTVYARLERDAEGFARLAEPSTVPPEQGAYIKARALRRFDGVSRVRLPFERYYLREDLAPEAEEIYRRRVHGQNPPAWAEVRVLGGHAVIEGLFIDGVAVEELIGSD